MKLIKKNKRTTKKKKKKKKRWGLVEDDDLQATGLLCSLFFPLLFPTFLIAPFPNKTLISSLSQSSQPNLSIYFFPTIFSCFSFSFIHTHISRQIGFFCNRMRMEAGANGGDEEVVDLPPGFRFHPTDEEIITHYLAKKVVNDLFASCAIGEADLNKCEPWDLPKRAKMGEKEWYFFCQKDRKYPTGMRTNRATESGYWKATGKDKEIFQGKNHLVGMKKTLVFYKGRAPKGEKSNWVMHEFRLDGELAYYHFSKPSKDEWVVCRVFHKSTGIRQNPIFPAGDSSSDSVLPLSEPRIYFSGPSPSFTHNEDDHDREYGVGNQYLFPSGTAMDANCGGNIPNVSDTLFTNPLFPKYENPSSSLFSSYMLGPQDSDYFVGYQGTTNEHHLAIAEDTSLKAEQFSSMVSPSQDTGVSTDVNGEITSSSAVSGYQHHTSGFYAYEDPERPSVDPISDILEYSWG